MSLSRPSVPDRTQPAVLLVEDEASMRELFRTFLVLHGHDVAEAGGGQDAKWHLQRRSFDVAVTDLWMPDGSGVDLIEYVRREHPATNVIAVTGRPKTLLPPDLVSGPRSLYAILEKPFPLDAFAATVRAAAKAATQPASLKEATA